MVLLKQLRKHINQFVAPDLIPIDNELNFYPEHPPSEKNCPKLSKQNTTELLEKPHIPSAYSHGLEDIYAIETIDLKTIKPLSTHSLKADSSKIQPSYKKYPPEKFLQKEFSFEIKFRTFINSFILNEPLYHLDFSVPCLKNLNELGYYFIGDLIGLDLNQLMIPPHFLSEIESKLTNKIQDQELIECRTINFESWIRSLLPTSDRIKFYLLLEKYSLQELIGLSSMMHIELKRKNPEEKKKEIQDAIEQLNSLDRIKLMHSYGHLVTHAFVFPWMRGRLGFAKEFEIIDFLEQIADNFFLFENHLKFLNEIYGKGNFFLKDLLCSHASTIYFTDEQTKNLFIKVEERALTYFANPEVIYELSELALLIAREFACTWQGFPEGFICKVLKSSTLFTCYKNQQQKILVALF